MWDWIVARAKEKSTWLGLVGLLTALGVSISADLSESIAAFGTAAGALISAILVAINTTKAE